MDICRTRRRILPKVFAGSSAVAGFSTSTTTSWFSSPGHEGACLAQRKLKSPHERRRESRHRPQTLNQTKITTMNGKKVILTLLSAAAFAVGCNKQQATSEQLDKVQAETKQAAQDMKDYTYAQKSAFVETMQSQLAALNRDLDQLAAKLEKSSDAVKTEAKPKLQALRDQTSQLNKKLDQVKNATESTWDSVKGGFKTAYASSRDGFNQARQWVSDKVAP
jgi:cytochrome c556